MFGKKESGQLETTIPWKKKYIKMKIVLLFFFLMSGIISMSKRSQPAGADDLTSSTNQSQWSQDHRICMNYKCYYNTYVPSYLLQMVQTASVSMTMRIVCVVVEC